MFKKILLLLLVAIALRLAPLICAASYPQPQGYVSDYTNTLSSGYKANLEASLKEFDQKTSSEIAVAMIPSLEGDTVENYAVRLFEQWKIGKKGKDNGVLLLIAKNDRKLRIEVGYGLEPVITDGAAGDIIRNDITPEFKTGNYEQGISNGIFALEKRISNGIIPIGSVTPAQAHDTYYEMIAVSILVFLFLFGIPIFLSLTYFLGRTKGILMGGFLGAALGIVLGFIFKTLIIGIALTVIFFLLGLLLDAICSAIYPVLKNADKKTWVHNAFDVWASGGKWGGGSGGNSGGFGGFGGGSSGGGGASGGW